MTSAPVGQDAGSKGLYAAIHAAIHRPRDGHPVGFISNPATAWLVTGAVLAAVSDWLRNSEDAAQVIARAQFAAYRRPPLPATLDGLPAKDHDYYRHGGHKTAVGIAEMLTDGSEQIEILARDGLRWAAEEVVDS